MNELWYEFKSAIADMVLCMSIYYIVHLIVLYISERKRIKLANEILKSTPKERKKTSAVYRLGYYWTYSFRSDNMLFSASVLWR